MLVLFYSNSENNFQIVKNVINKKHIYQENVKNNISLKNFSKIELKIPKNNKVKLNNFEHFFCSFFNGCKKRKTMKILNLCNNFVLEYLSAENIIFNSILFESFYEDNPIKLKSNQYLKEIENEIFSDNENDFLFYNINDT